MASAPVWRPVLAAPSSRLAEPKAAPAFRLKVLPQNQRIKSSSDFARATKSGVRLSSKSLVGYFYQSPKSDEPAKLGLIVGKSVGNSVVRHRISRQIRHAIKEDLKMLPKGSLFVVRALTNSVDIFTQAKELLNNHKKQIEKVKA